MSIAHLDGDLLGSSVNLDPTIPAPMTNVAEHGFEGRFQDWADDAQYFEYSKAANPIRSGHTPKVPIVRFGPELYQDGATGVVPLDLSKDLGIRTGAATSPAGSRAVFHADADAALYWVHDEPLLRYLGAEATTPRFRATKYRRADAVAKLQDIASRPGANGKSRVSVLLANAEEEQTLTITHVLWAMFGLLPPDQEQRPHRHQSVALDLILDAQPGCYTLLGTHLDDRGDIADPTRVDWEAGGAFVTPPGMWHAHFNESGAPAHLIPIQDAGMHTYLRSLDIRFTDRR